MKWPWNRDSQGLADVDARLAEAAKEAAKVKARAERVAAQLEGRLRRNHFGQTVAEIARREQR